MARTLDEAEEQTYGNVRLLITSRVESLILDRILKNYHVKHPNVSFRIDVLTSPEIPPLIQQGQATAGVSLIRKLPTNVGAELLARVKYGLYCGLPHRLYGNSNLTVTDLRTENFVTFATDHLGGVLSPLTIYREQHGYEGKVVGTSYNLDEIKRMAFAGIGIGLFPCHIVEHDVENGRLWQLPPLEGIGPIDWYFLWDKTANLTNSEYLFVELAKAEIANTPIELRVR
ncbi:MAG: substrate-binding domain-containing protein [Hyphomicrobiales bacterium]